MPTPRTPFILALVLFACTERPLGETEGSTAGSSTGDAPPVTGTNTDAPGTATLPTTTSTPPSPTTATSDEPGTTTIDPSGATTIEPSGSTVDPSGATEIDPQPKFDFQGPQTGLLGCPLDAPAGTMVSGSSSLGPFAAQRAWFGYSGIGDAPLTPILLFVSPEADPAAELAGPKGSTGPTYYASVSTDPLHGGGWIGTWPVFANVYADGMIGDPPRPDAVVIDELAGSWETFDPADPPRLVGSLQGGIAGPFDAVYCEKLTELIIPE